MRIFHPSVVLRSCPNHRETSGSIERNRFKTFLSNTISEEAPPLPTPNLMWSCLCSYFMSKIKRRRYYSTKRLERSDWILKKNRGIDGTKEKRTIPRKSEKQKAGQRR
ncbi:predicted protein [Arabidopsis lyrata subsp. lyrata]|uniref:Predicted protein n=1 Tax=Arabidopsis lyrata subsp. lyrata TaxID=81972 RepID=D7M4U8_ARALL|nr:predicted protein [Arabidopsis lyrata subsp. lyrata]